MDGSKGKGMLRNCTNSAWVMPVYRKDQGQAPQTLSIHRYWHTQDIRLSRNIVYISSSTLQNIHVLKCPYATKSMVLKKPCAAKSSRAEKSLYQNIYREKMSMCRHIRRAKTHMCQNVSVQNVKSQICGKLSLPNLLFSI